MTCQLFFCCSVNTPLPSTPQSQASDPNTTHPGAPSSPPAICLILLISSDFFPCLLGLSSTACSAILLKCSGDFILAKGTSGYKLQAHWARHKYRERVSVHSQTSFSFPAPFACPPGQSSLYILPKASFPICSRLWGDTVFPNRPKHFLQSSIIPAFLAAKRQIL